MLALTLVCDVLLAVVTVAVPVAFLGWYFLGAAGWPAAALLLVVLPLLAAHAMVAVRRAREQERLRIWGNKGHARLTSDVEAVAHTRFSQGSKPGDTDAIRPADNGVREDGDR